MKQAAPQSRTVRSQRVSEDFLLRGQEFLELGIVLQEGEFRLLCELIAVLESFFERLPDIQNRAVLYAGVRIGLGQIVMKFGALFHALILQQCALRTPPLENFRIEGQSPLVDLARLHVVFPGKIGRAEIAENGGGIRRDTERFLILLDRAPVGLARIKNRPKVVDRLRVAGVKLNGLFVIFPRVDQILQLVISNPSLVCKHGGFFGSGLVIVQCVAVHFARHHMSPRISGVRAEGAGSRAEATTSALACLTGAPAWNAKPVTRTSEETANISRSSTC